MSYPSGPPGNPGYQSGPQAPQYGAPSPQYGAPQEAAPAGPSKLPLYLDAGVAALGLAIYLTTFGLGADVLIGVLAGVLAGLLAGVGLLPKQKSRYALVAVLATLSFLLIVAAVVSAGISNVDWPAYLLIAFTLLQAVVAVGALLLDAGVITAPEPKPHYDQSYGQYGAPGGYYGQSHQDYGQQGPPQHGGPPQQRPAYTQVTQYGGGYSNAPGTGGFASQIPAPGSPQHDAQNGPPTPPTGFPAFGQPQQPAPPSETSAQTHSFESQQSPQHAAPPTPPPPS